MIRGIAASVADSMSMANLNTAFLPDGALCWCTDLKSLFALNKESVLADATDQVISPVAGPGKWERVVSSATNASGAALVTSAVAAYATNGNWGLSTGSNFTLEATPPANNWTLGAGGLLTYNGPEASFNVELAASASVTDATFARIIYAGISKNADLTGAASAAAHSNGTTAALANSIYALAVGRRVLMATGDTLAPVFGVIEVATGLGATMNMIITPA
jgi:hypothetical protein